MEKLYFLSVQRGNKLVKLMRYPVPHAEAVTIKSKFSIANQSSILFVEAPCVAKDGDRMVHEWLRRRRQGLKKLRGLSRNARALSLAKQAKLIRRIGGREEVSRIMKLRCSRY